MTEQLNISELRERIDAAITTVCSGMAAMSIPPNPRDVDLVLADCAKMLDERDQFAKTIADAAYDVGEYDHLQEAEELLQQCVAKYSYEQVSKVGKRLRQWRDKWALILDTQWQVSKERDALKAKLAALVDYLRDEIATSSKAVPSTADEAIGDSERVLFCQQLLRHEALAAAKVQP